MSDKSQKLPADFVKSHSKIWKSSFKGKADSESDSSDSDKGKADSKSDSSASDKGKADSKSDSSASEKGKADSKSSGDKKAESCPLDGDPALKGKMTRDLPLPPKGGKAGADDAKTVADKDDKSKGSDQKGKQILKIFSLYIVFTLDCSSWC